MITARGVGLLAAGVVALGAGFAYGYPELVLLGTAALVAVGFALAYAAWRPALRVRRVAEPDRVERGSSCAVTLTVSNAGRLRATTVLAEDRCGAATVPVPLVRLRPGRDTDVGYPVPTDRRGVVPIGPLRVIRQDPLGLAALARAHGDAVNVWVYPRILPLTAVPAGVARSLDGRVDRVAHGSITFDALREYVVGDELRHVHWRTSARVGELMVREHLDTSLPRIVVLLDDRAAAYPQATEAFESACEAAASVVAAAVREELPVALRLVGGAAADSGGRRADTARPFLDLLAEADLSAPAGGLAPAVDRLRHDPAGDTLIYLTGPDGRGGLGEVASLRGRYPSLLAAVLGATATTPSPVPLARGAAGPAGAPGGQTGGWTGGQIGARGLVVLNARDGDDFAAEWEGVGRW
jgi:uncharacterized protein (DUF58 family)